MLSGLLSVIAECLLHVLNIERFIVLTEGRELAVSDHLDTNWTQWGADSIMGQHHLLSFTHTHVHQ